MKRIYCTLLLCVAFPFFAGAEKLIQTFKDVPLTEALLGIERQQETYRIHFVYNDLENYRVTTRIHQLRTRDAVLAVCENLPVKVWGKGKDIFVESLERSKEENTKTAPTNPLAQEKTKELKEIDVNASMVVCVPKAGTLSTILTQEQRDTLTSLSLSGKLNSADIRTLRHMAGYKEEGCRTGRLKWLDLREVEFVTDSKPYLVLDATEENIVGSVWPISYNTHSFDETETYILPTNAYGFGGSKTSYIGGGAAYYGFRYKIFCESTHSTTTFGRGYEEISFSNNLDTKTWKRMKRRKMLKFPGHRIQKDKERYLWESYLRKGHFCYDTFCLCPSLQTVVLPQGSKIDKKVLVCKDRIAYYVTK